MIAMTVQPITPRPTPQALRLMLAIQKAQAAGFVHFAAALARLLQAERSR